jgi:hypothetical protein
MLTTTLNRIRAHSPCEEGWRKLLAGLGKTAPDDEPLPYARIVEINGIDDALWCCRAEPQHVKEWRLFAVWCARQVQHLMTDARSITALEVAERHANGKATDKELAAAGDAARAAARAASRDAAGAAAGAAAWDAAGAAAWDAAGAATMAATMAATRAAAGDAARAAARTAAWAAARDATRAAQTLKFKEIVSAALAKAKETQQ